MKTQVTVRAFGRLIEIVPVDTSLTVAFPVSVADLREAVLAEFPDAAGIPIRVAVDGTLVGDDDTVTDGAEVALFPPFSGG